MTDVAIIGAGPAGLIAAERLAGAGLEVAVFERMPSVGRKLLMAGRGGLNLTHSEPFELFLSRYREAAPHLEPALRAFPPQALRDWAHGLGEETFIGSSGRVFPKSFKASPLLRAWLTRLNSLGVTVHTRHELCGFGDARALQFHAPDGVREVAPRRAALFALGGASWPKLGATGSWAPWLRSKGVEIAPFQPANSGVQIAWSEYFRERFAGMPLKRVRLTVGNSSAMGEMMVTRSGFEGGAVYALSAAIREALAKGAANLMLDLRPDLEAAEIAQRLERVRPGETLSNRLRKALKLTPVQLGVMREAAGAEPGRDPEVLARMVKQGSLPLTGVCGLERAISSAGGTAFSALTAGYELKSLPGHFAAGEMLDWEAPTGGYLLQACFATGWAAAGGILGQNVRAA